MSGNKAGVYSHHSPGIGQVSEPRPETQQSDQNQHQVNLRLDHRWELQAAQSEHGSSPE